VFVISPVNTHLQHGQKQQFNSRWFASTDQAIPAQVTSDSRSKSKSSSDAAAAQDAAAESSAGFGRSYIEHGLAQSNVPAVPLREQSRMMSHLNYLQQQDDNVLMDAYRAQTIEGYGLHQRVNFRFFINVQICRNLCLELAWFCKITVVKSCVLLVIVFCKSCVCHFVSVCNLFVGSFVVVCDMIDV
jgi:hypothetical protein